MTILNKIIAPKDNADDEVLVSKLYFSNGQKVQKEDELAELETSKTSISIASEDTGYIENCVSEGEYIKVGEVIIIIHSSKKSVDDSIDIKNEDTSEDPSEDNTVFNEKLISENARKYIKENNIDIASIEKNFITLEDVSSLGSVNNKKFQKEDDKEVIGTTSSKISLAKINEIKALTSVQSAGIVSTIFISIESIKKIQEYKEPLFAGSDSLLPLIVFEVSRLLKKYPILNAYFENNTVRMYNDINIGVAFDIDNGLKVFTIKNTEQLSISSIEKSISIGIDDYLNKSLTTDQISGSTFTITDLSSFGAINFVPLINFNQAAILGISCIDEKLNRVNVSLSFDHRVTEGKVASQFLLELKERIEAYLKIYSRVDNEKNKARCNLCLKTLSEDKKMNGHGLIKMVNHDGDNILVCNVCLDGWT
jgi:pyruvate/2-oxoglutarate dehydrogenase complex dihydrolipoamide acyltransferase (E2) component